MTTAPPSTSTDAAPERSELRQHFPLLLASSLSFGFGLAGMSVFLLGIFAGPVTAELGWSLGFFQLAAPMILPAMIFIGPLVGSLADRYGSRRIAVPSLILFGLAMASLGFVTSSGWTWIVAWLVIGATGCGTAGMAWAPAITSRFNRQRGIALAIMLSGSSIVAIAGPSLVRLLIDTLGWRLAYVALGAVPIFVAAPLVAFLARAERPVAQTAESVTSLSGHTVGEALRDRSFWVLALALAAGTLAMGGQTANLVPILISVDYTPAAAAGLAGVLGGALIVGSIATGFLLDRFPAQVVAACVMALPIFSLPLLMFGGPTFAIAGIAILGFSASAEFNLAAYICSRLFGNRAFGRIYALTIIAPSVASSFGGPLLGTIYDRTGSFASALLPVTCFILLGSALLLTLRIPRAERVQERLDRECSSLPG